METINLAPIVMFVYARPEHTKRTLEALSNNTLAGQSRLIVYVDGVKQNAFERDEYNNNEVRRIIRSKKWCKEVEIIESSINKGLAKSIRDGVTEVVNRYGKVIVVEDDLVTSPAFLSYMNKALDFYEKYPAVFSIGGYTYPSRLMHIPEDYPYDTYACLRNCSWGWATWKDRWDMIDWNATNYAAMKNNPAMKQAFNRMGDDEFEMFQQQQEKGLNIWSILFTMAHFENHAVAIIPCKSYVDNIGLDGTGENCGVQTALSHSSLCENENPHFLDVIYEDKRIINAFYNVNCRKRLPLWKRAINHISVMLTGKKAFLKGVVYVKS
mgnify:CR=1 FL=1